jgi:hypothetical protein
MNVFPVNVLEQGGGGAALLQHTGVPGTFCLFCYLVLALAVQSKHYIDPPFTEKEINIQRSQVIP